MALGVTSGDYSTLLLLYLWIELEAFFIRKFGRTIAKYFGRHVSGLISSGVCGVYFCICIEVSRITYFSTKRISTGFAPMKFDFLTPTM